MPLLPKLRERLFMVRNNLWLIVCVEGRQQRGIKWTVVISDRRVHQHNHLMGAMVCLHNTEH